MTVSHDFSSRIDWRCCKSCDEVINITNTFTSRIFDNTEACDTIFHALVGIQFNNISWFFTKEQMKVLGDVKKMVSKMLDKIVYTDIPSNYFIILSLRSIESFARWKCLPTEFLIKPKLIIIQNVSNPYNIQSRFRLYVCEDQIPN